jgi:hypothetical protein
LERNVIIESVRLRRTLSIMWVSDKFRMGGYLTLDLAPSQSLRILFDIPGKLVAPIPIIVPTRSTPRSKTSGC